MESGRGKMMLTLALNKELEKKLAKVREKKRPLTKLTDPEYLPPENIDDFGSSCSSTCSSEQNETDIIDEDLNDENLNDITNNNNELKADESIITNILQDIIHTVFVETHKRSQKKIFTKKGLIRKRKLLDLSVTERKKRKLEKTIEEHNVKKPCTEKCHLKCPQIINSNRQEEVNSQFWKLDKAAQRAFVLSCIKKQVKKRNTTRKETSRRENSYKYSLKNEDAIEVFVCKTFLLATLGFGPNNDRIIKAVRDSDFTAITPKKDMRGYHPNATKIDRSVLIEHIQSFRPTISHYRREHAPHRLYLPSDISVTYMYKHFKEKYPSIKLSYELYRKQVSEMNISFTKLGNEECYECEKFDLHTKVTTGHEKTDLNLECDECLSWNTHKEKYVAARAEYQKDSKCNLTEKLVVSGDLQKIIMLPRAEMFKEVIFIPRVIVFNESFVPAGKPGKSVQPTAVIWHEGVTGRKKEDLISTFYSFLIKNRDCHNITIWLDNCAAQNKNWALFCFFVYVVNCSEVEVENLEIKYFQSGHTFMAADSFHHQVELSMKRKAKVYDFNDFKCAVQEANSSKVDVIEMQVNDFFDWRDLTSKYKLSKVSPKPYLNDMVFVLFRRGEKILRYKNKFTDEFTELNFLSANYFKGELPKAKPKTECKGISKERKENLIAKLRPILPINRISFWEELYVSTDNNESIDD